MHQQERAGGVAVLGAPAREAVRALPSAREAGGELGRPARGEGREGRDRADRKTVW